MGIDQCASQRRGERLTQPGTPYLSSPRPVSTGRVRWRSHAEITRTLFGLRSVGRQGKAAEKNAL